ncbi:MAG: hypothetical protein QOI99_1221 [Actinomycetota bacterium]|jgi:hypothetical protein|nr:hypothetical protein [Actinomycetota bacterium]
MRSRSRATGPRLEDHEMGGPSNGGLGLPDCRRTASGVGEAFNG